MNTFNIFILIALACFICALCLLILAAWKAGKEEQKEQKHASYEIPKKSDNWKPSEEQIETLKCLPGLLRNFKLDSSARMLEVLYEQLKKLM